MVDILKVQNGIGDIYVRESTYIIGTAAQAVVLKDGEKLVLEYESRFGKGKLMSTFTIGSVASYAIRNDDCPIEAIERAKKLGHELVYIFGNGSCIHNGPRSTVKHVMVEYGMLVYFQGHFYTIEKAPNSNLTLKPYLA